AWGDCTRLADFGTAFASARAAGEGYGVGFVLLLEDGFAALDLDDCLDAEGVAKPWARPLLDGLELLDAYLEVSPRGRGLRAFVKAELPRAVKHLLAPEGDKLEAWSHSRWVSITGRRISEESEVPECDVVELLATIAPEVKGEPPSDPQENHHNGTSSTPK